MLHQPVKGAWKRGNSQAAGWKQGNHPGKGEYTEVFNQAPNRVAKQLRAKSRQGITRSEVMFVIVILAIFAILAIPAYLKQVEKYRFSEVDSSYDRHSIEYLAQTATEPNGEFGPGSNS